MTMWELAGLLSKAVIYTGMLAAIGGMLMLWMTQQHQQSAITIVRRYMIPALLVGLLATCLNFLVQIGSVNQRGVAGMFDPLIGSILVDTEIGTGLRWRLAGFLLGLLSLVPLNLPGFPFQHIGARRFTAVCGLAAAGCFAMAVAVLGHASAVSAVAQSLVALHLLAIACWAGALYPLYLLLTRTDSHDLDSVSNLATVLERFGVYAWLMLAVMLVTGIVLIWLVAGGPGALLSSSHGQLLLAKIILVAAMMALGALHKFRWVPRLRAAVSHSTDDVSASINTAAGSQTALVHTASRSLARSIRVETLLAVLVLLLTAALTTVTGPA